MTFLALKFKDYLTTFEHINEAYHLDSFEASGPLVRCLPEGIRERWVELSEEPERGGFQHKFRDLVDLVNDWVCFNTSSFYHSASKPRKDIIIENDNARDRNVSALTRSGQKQIIITCPKCDGKLRLDKCDYFLKLPINNVITL